MGERDEGVAGGALGPGLPGTFNALTDVEGVEVGHCTLDEPPFLTGATAVLARNGAVAAVDARGGAPATRETDALALENLVDEVHGVVLCGGSAYGLAAADGVMRFLEEHGVGRPVGAGPGEVVPIVPAAALFDLGRGGAFAARPDASCGYAAAAAARRGPVAQGNVGAGTGALFGGRRLKGGVGSASVATPAGTVAALVALNAVGSAFDLSTGRLFGAGFALGDELGRLVAPSAEELAAFAAGAASAAGAPHARDGGAGGGSGAAGDGRHAPLPAGARLHTVIGLVATDVALAKTEVQRLARVAHDGLARAVRPSHTLFDGDVLFALSTGMRPLAGVPAGGGAPARIPTAGHGLERALALVELCELAADCVARSVVHAVLAARSTAGFVAYGDAFPSAVSTVAAPPGTSASRKTARRRAGEKG